MRVNCLGQFLAQSPPDPININWQEPGRQKDTEKQQTPHQGPRKGQAVGPLSPQASVAWIGEMARVTT